MSWLQRSSSSHNVQLGLTAVISGVVAACAVVGYQQIRRKERIQRIRDEIPEVAEEHGVNMIFSNVESFNDEN
jgi:hypothetical protein